MKPPAIIADTVSTGGVEPMSSRPRRAAAQHAIDWVQAVDEQ